MMFLVIITFVREHPNYNGYSIKQITQNAAKQTIHDHPVSTGFQIHVSELSLLWATILTYNSS